MNKKQEQKLTIFNISYHTVYQMTMHFIRFMQSIIDFSSQNSNIN